MTTWIHRTFLIPASLIDVARNMADCINPAAVGMFTTPLSFNGELPADYYISSGLVEDTWGPLFYTETVDPETGEKTRVDTPPEHLYGACQMGAEEQGKELTVTLQNVTDLLVMGDVSDESGPDAMTRLGLQFVNTEDDAEEE